MLQAVICVDLTAVKPLTGDKKGRREIPKCIIQKVISAFKILWHAAASRFSLTRQEHAARKQKEVSDRKKFLQLKFSISVWGKFFSQ